MLESMEDILIPIVAILSAVVVPPLTIAFVLLKYFSGKNKERMAMIAQGIIPQEAERKKKGTPERLRTLRTALGAIGAGVGVVVGIILNNYVLVELDTLEKLAVVAGFASLFFGIGYTIYFIVSKDKIAKEAETDIDEVE